MDAIWEEWDLVCAPTGCDPFETVLRTMVYGFLVIAFCVAYAAVRPWLRSLHPILATAASAAVAAIVVWIGTRWVVATGSLRWAAILIGVGLVATLVGRPRLLRRVSEEPAPTSATH